MLPFRAEDRKQIVFLLLTHQARSDERRIAHNVVERGLGDEPFPIHAQGIAFHDVGIRFQRQKVEGHIDDILGGFHHLGFCNPECGLRDGHSEVVDFNAVKLMDGDFDDIPEIHQLLPGCYKQKGFILKTAQGNIGFRQKVTRTAGRVKERQMCKFFAKRFRLFVAEFRHFYAFDGGEFFTEFVKKQRVNHLVNIFD